MKNPKKIEIDGGLAMAMIGSGVICIPIFGYLPLLAISLAVSASYVIADHVRFK